MFASVLVRVFDWAKSLFCILRAVKLVLIKFFADNRSQIVGKKIKQQRTTANFHMNLDSLLCEFKIIPAADTAQIFNSQFHICRGRQ